MERKKIKVFFYKSALCPRCMLAGRELAEIHENFPAIEIEEIDIALSPLRAWKDSIRFIPSLRSGDTILSGLFLNRNKIEQFLKNI